MRQSWIGILAITATISCATGCESTRKAEARRRESMENYSFSYSYPKSGLPTPQDKRTLRDLEAEGWRPVREERSTKGDQIAITVFFER